MKPRMTPYGPRWDCPYCHRQFTKRRRLWWHLVKWSGT